MRIKKVSQTTSTQAQVVDGYSASTTDSYSCNYVNEINTYSTNEIRIGTWMNKPLYRKCYEVTIPINVNHGLTDFNIVDVYGNYKNNNGVSFPIPSMRVTYPEYNLGCYVNSTQIVFEAGVSVSGNGYVVLEYTKTTD